MESKEVLTLIKNLDQSKTNDQIVLDILKTLEKEVVPTEKLLRETKVGVEVNKFKKSTNPEVAKLVRKIISAWKDVINKNKLKLRQQQQQPSSNGTVASDSKTDGSNKNPVSSTVTTDANGSISKKVSKFQSSKTRNAKNDGVNTIIYHIKLRDNVIRALYDALAKESEHPPNYILQLAIEIEKEMNKLNDIMTHEKQYKEKYRVIYSSIISKNNADLKIKITNGDLTPNFLVTCDPKELAPESLRKKLEEIKEKNLFNAQGATIERSVTDRFQCGKCKERKVSYYQLQTRSADEPLTTFCTCEVCGNRWKFS
ncbi:similar to Saccharomyces cerevisiae YGL043W DST1 General transcription elongation factor TFIIS [Maudiozyma barnettii]|uniref:Transcription elongation factor n=1 Tax=Maudiozyma barnettii TaxID=61262 RepID=A0A8H2ZK32_9SACH|nr:transcription elongation factor DST1 [Kazachstania barnettii]CAB4256563.1 similar to Saccharomyces cerevisiae YGL043W DST1 General transcription elongation factor TFIIS [Kazachstania barnettii]CAD1785166.1 similar to Saccharomyces cerevisiae YGL043W DST1 General transcription elongation factor TFIIS [Kazachstania barnettii]